MSQGLSLIEEFNQRVIKAHNFHYENNPDGLIDRSKTASPNGNQIYHFYSNGEITFQKGAWAYRQRSEFNLEYSLNNSKNFAFKFVNLAADNITYAILTQNECENFRKEMEEIIKKSGKK